MKFQPLTECGSLSRYPWPKVYITLQENELVPTEKVSSRCSAFVLMQMNEH